MNEPTPASELPTYRADDARTIYASIMRVWASPFEFVLVFGQLDAGIQATSELRLREVGSVAMSPQHAKSMLKVLAGRLARWEAEFGEIPETQLGLPADPNAEAQPPEVITE